MASTTLVEGAFFYFAEGFNRHGFAAFSGD